MRIFVAVLAHFVWFAPTVAAQDQFVNPYHDVEFVARFEQLQYAFDRLQYEHPIDRNVTYSGMANTHTGVPVETYAMTIPVDDVNIYVVYNLDSVLDTPHALMIHSAHRTYCHILSMHVARSDAEKRTQAISAERCVKEQVGSDAYAAFKSLYHSLADNLEHPLQQWASERVKFLAH